MDYLFSLNEFSKLVDSLKGIELANPSPIEKKTGIYYSILNLQSNLKLVLELAENNCKTQPLVTLARMIIDNYSILYLLTSFSSQEEQQLRYYLYLLDSISMRTQIIQEFMEGMKNYTPENSLTDTNNVIDRDQRAISIILNKIESENLSNITTKKNLFCHNWKFVSITPPTNSYYNWKELYNISKIPTHFSMVIQKHFSAFVHGLGTVLIYQQKNKGMEESVMSLLMIIQFLTSQIILNEYPENTKDIELDSEFLRNVNKSWNDWK